MLFLLNYIPTLLIFLDMHLFFVIYYVSIPQISEAEYIQHLSW